MCVYLHVCARTFGNSLFGGATSKRVHRYFFLSWERGSSGAANAEELNWIFVEWGGGDSRSLVELSKAVGGCLFPLRRDVVCWLILNYCDSVTGNQLENFKCLNWPFEHWGPRPFDLLHVLWEGAEGPPPLRLSSWAAGPCGPLLPQLGSLHTQIAPCTARTVTAGKHIFPGAWGKGTGPNWVDGMHAWL